MQFKLFSALALIALLRSASSLPEAIPDPDGTLVARDCDYDTGCRSVDKSNDYWHGAGKYCGFCYQVQGDWEATHIYQLNGNSKSKKGCCDYGVNNDCKEYYNKHKNDAHYGYRDCKNNDRGY